MAARIPVRFEWVAAAFQDVSRVGLCESSGSEHSPESPADLSDLVNSFIERDGEVDGDDKEVELEKEQNHEEYSPDSSDSETKEMLRDLFGWDHDGADGDHHNDLKHKIRAETRHASRGLIVDRSSPAFKRQLMARLRDRGFDAGLCKSKWAKSGRFPAGDYEYIDVNISGNRYIVEVLLAREFEIARPTDRYTSLLDVFPPIFVGTVEDLKQVVRLMCRAIKESMKSSDMHVPPWRRNGYMQFKWFGSYKRTTNEVPKGKARSDNHAVAGKRSVGFEALPAISYHCRVDFASKVGLRVGHLTAALEGSGMGMQSLNVE
ncbi:uncharacterized protein LOC121264870 [Juglans microcarpa x Juglans regia]|uniref:uncharacterized protein LOC121264870 n=1 Tax=Juglans microcarpa x Juglans regia TaxID=2249226 RepID=UPI001B7EA8B3|nr:uncharacterized protein LOC121264870 [Juglans microcarpa x Juglans regia]XP_041024133.1 uncharacterized protein LOC121264870 [Juglans microcarpa x Juglans regia]